MKKLNVEVTINASQEAVWNAITEDAKYREWTTAFHEGSYFVGGWNKGDKIKFLGPNEDGTEGGMVSEIAESRKPEYISILHKGMITKDGTEDYTSEEVKKWAPMYENYIIEKADDNTTRFKLDMESPDEYYDMFQGMWTKALVKLKEVAERQS